MSAQDNVKLAQQIYGLFSTGQVQAVSALATEDIELALYPFGQTFRGRDGFINFMLGFTTAFPDLKIEVKNQVATDDQVVNEFTAHGTHRGPLMTPAGVVPPTGRAVEFTVCEVWRVKNGKVSSLHNYQDSASIMRQLGLIN